MFATQKNRVWGKVIGQGESKDPLICSKAALVCLILHSRTNSATSTSSLGRYFTGGKCRDVTPTDISKTLNTTVTFLGPSIGFKASDISDRSLWAEGVIDLLWTAIDSDIIKLIGQWRSYEILRYMHVQAKLIMKNFLALIVRYGFYNLLQSATNKVSC